MRFQYRFRNQTAIPALALTLGLGLASGPWARAEEDQSPAPPEPSSEPQSAAPEDSPSPSPLPSPSPSSSVSREARRSEVKSRWMAAVVPGYGYSHMDNSPAANASTPLFNWGLDAQLGFRLTSWLQLGLMTGFKYTGHRSSALTAVSSNARGTRISLIQPWLGVELGGLRLGFARQLMGDYVLLNPAADGSLFRYSEVSGTRVELTHRLFNLGPGRLRIGVVYERLIFNRSYKNGTSQSVDLEGIRLTHFAIVVPYEF